MNKTKFLVVDDDQSLLRVMEHHLAEAGYSISTCTDGISGLLKQKDNPAKVIFTDLKMPDVDGIEFIRSVREFDSNAVIVVITGYPTIDAAVDAMKAGAFDFIQKPVERERLLAVAKKAVEYSNLQTENTRLRILVDEHLDFGNMVGQSAVMQHVYRNARKVSASNVTVLISGETGTGKEILARAIHQNSSRKEYSFVPVNCAAVPSTLLESELFGHVKGAFTGAISDRKGRIEDANGGTLFLDEIGDLPLELQPKLLRVLQDREVQPVGSNRIKKTDVRFIVATHRNLEEMIKQNTFREDLYYRLNVVPITLPPLRDRHEDTLPLFKLFLKEAAQREKRPVPPFSAQVIEKLEAYSWPGNVRELQNLAQRLMAMQTGEIIDIEDLPESFLEEHDKQDFITPLPKAGFDLEEWTDRVVLAALEKNQWNQSKTARYLNISRNTLIYRIEKSPRLREAKQKFSK